MFKTEIRYEKMASTSDYLKENYEHFSDFTIIRANHQTKGRGQFDRTWQSEANQNLLCSILLKEVKISQMDQIKEAVLDGLSKTIHAFGLNARFKAPNDLYVNDKKICGVLIENLIEDDCCLYVVVGIGLNINQTEFKDLNATSIVLEKTQTVDVESVYQVFIHELEKNIGGIYATKGLH